MYKSGTGTWGRVCGDLRLEDAETKDLRTSSMGTRGRVGRRRGDVKNRDAGDAGCE